MTPTFLLFTVLPLVLSKPKKRGHLYKQVLGTNECHVMVVSANYTALSNKVSKQVIALTKYSIVQRQ